MTKSTIQECVNPESVPSQNQVDPGQEKNPNNGARIDPCRNLFQVLVLFTPPAQNAVTNINQTIDLAVSQYNTTIYNSGTTSAIAISSAFRQLHNFMETNNLQNDVNALAANPTVQALRNQFNADAVILLTNASNYTAYGIVRNIGPINMDAYAIAQIGSATANYTFTHEIGDLFGARHQQNSLFTGGDDTPGYAHGYSFSYGLFGQNKCTTMMHNLRSGWTRIQNFSNPNVSAGAATGTASGNNNARQINEQATTVAAFRPYNVLGYIRPGIREYFRATYLGIDSQLRHRTLYLRMAV